jgi:hypothetical protein
MYALFRRRSNELCGRDHRCPDGGYQYWQLEEQQWFAVTSTHVGAKVQVPYQLSSTSVPERPRGTLRSYMMDPHKDTTGLYSFSSREQAPRPDPRAFAQGQSVVDTLWVQRAS